MRIGLNTGEVIASGALRGDLLVTGDAVNVAARLQQAAEAGTILVGERTVRAARSHFTFRALGAPLDLRGKSTAVDAWLVVGERETAEPRSLPGLTAPLVGRAHELDSLRTLFDRTSAERRPALVTVIGDAGIGKSRLVAEFVAPLEDDADILFGRCLPSGQGVALAPLADMLKAEAGVFETDSSAAASAKIEEFARTAIDADLAADPARTEAALESTLGLRTRDDPLAHLIPRDRYRELIGAWRALLASLPLADRVLPDIQVAREHGLGDLLALPQGLAADGGLPVGVGHYDQLDYALDVPGAGVGVNW